MIKYKINYKRKKGIEVEYTHNFYASDFIHAMQIAKTYNKEFIIISLYEVK